MNIEKITENNINVAVVSADDTIITDVDSALDDIFFTATKQEAVECLLNV